MTLKEHHYEPAFRSRRIELARASIVYIKTGSGRLFIDEHSYTVHAGSIVALKPGTTFIVHNHSALPLELLLLQYQSVQLASVTASRPLKATEADSSYPSASAAIATPVRSASAATLLEHLQKAWTNRSELGFIRLQSLFHELLLDVYSRSTTAQRNAMPSIQAMLTYLEENYAKPIAIHQLPEMAGMTASSFCRAFKKRTGMTPIRYLTQIRMIKAKELMSHEGMPLKDIAICVGYQDELYFSRVFKKVEGVPPSVYTKRREKKIAVISTFLLQDHLLALGILPVAAPSYPNYFRTATGFPSYLEDRLPGTAALNADRTITYSDVIPFAPDMIIKSVYQHSDADTDCSSEPNTIVLDHSTTWEQYLRRIAERVKKEAEAERIIRHLSKLEQEARRKLERVTQRGSWVIIRLIHQRCRLYGTQDHTLTELFYSRLGFQPDERIAHGMYQEDAYDRLIELDPENILVVWSEEDELNAFSARKGWQNLQAVRQNRVFIPDSKEWDPWGPIGREHMLRMMVKYFERR
ncbi:AraC-like DNA-binding protein [Paenibacillus phyllosphaerae]|uniref:AraC-like DNA-binding protein n=1 Tax=Paenibacillus phyllosphaerae TaxID=274593 RepID=A0A7W5FNZ2_9BACL|nr:helix-turn-helix domain-containing protein [Paenibacillus phyllosphaerae]MBB3111703.1 AraC-like DNA-binding protein [Paenibacillus phyllosphaerae]